MNVFDAHERRYTVKGKEVTAKVIRWEQVDSGAIEATVQTSCLAPDGQVSHQTNELTLTDPTSGTQLEGFMQGCAEWLQKLLWEQPRVVMFHAEMQKSDGTYFNLTCHFNISNPHTFVHPDWVKLAGLPQVGILRPPENPAIRLPVHRALIRFGVRQFQTDVVATNVNVMCSIGTNLVLQAVGERPELIYDVFSTDINRALRNAARSKETTVLILGAYADEGRNRLNMIRSALRALGFNGVILDDFVDIHQQSLFEKMLMFGAFARFIICDDSVASGHLIELKACADIEFVTAILRKQGRPVTWMNADIAAGRNWMRTFAYVGDDAIEAAVHEAVAWAQQKVGERADHHNREYPWRSPYRSVG